MRKILRTSLLAIFLLIIANGQIINSFEPVSTPEPLFDPTQAQDVGDDPSTLFDSVINVDSSVIDPQYFNVRVTHLRTTEDATLVAMDSTGVSKYWSTYLSNKAVKSIKIDPNTVTINESTGVVTSKAKVVFEVVVNVNPKFEVSYWATRIEPDNPAAYHYKWARVQKYEVYVLGLLTTLAPVLKQDYDVTVDVGKVQRDYEKVNDLSLQKIRMETSYLGAASTTVETNAGLVKIDYAAPKSRLIETKVIESQAYAFGSLVTLDETQQLALTGTWTSILGPSGLSESSYDAAVIADINRNYYVRSYDPTTQSDLYSYPNGWNSIGYDLAPAGTTYPYSGDFTDTGIRAFYIPAYTHPLLRQRRNYVQFSNPYAAGNPASIRIYDGVGPNAIFGVGDKLEYDNPTHTSLARYISAEMQQVGVRYRLQFTYEFEATSTLTVAEGVDTEAYLGLPNIQLSSFMWESGFQGETELTLGTLSRLDWYGNRTTEFENQFGELFDNWQLSNISWPNLPGGGLLDDLPTGSEILNSLTTVLIIIGVVAVIGVGGYLFVVYGLPAWQKQRMKRQLEQEQEEQMRQAQQRLQATKEAQKTQRRK